MEEQWANFPFLNVYYSEMKIQTQGSWNKANFFWNILKIC